MLFYKWWELKIRKEIRVSRCVDASILDHEPGFVAGLALLHNQTFDDMVGGLCKALHHVACRENQSLSYFAGLRHWSTL